MVLEPWQHHAKVVISLTNWIRTMTISHILLVSGDVLTVLSTSFSGAIELRTNDPVYVKMDEKFCLEQCTGCHSVNLEGQSCWRQSLR